MNKKHMIGAGTYDELIEDLADIGHEVTHIIQGAMGWGKSAMLNALGALPRFEDYILIYVDCTTKSDSGDFFMIKYSEDGKTFKTLPHEELGLHLGKPVIIMFDEIGKMPRSAFNSVLRILYEKKYGDMELHPDSIVFATTNFAAEGLGDMLPAHGRNRVLVRSLIVPTKLEWLGWAIKKGVHEFILSYANQNDHIFSCFLDWSEVGQHPECYDPRATDIPTAFITGRSMAEAASPLFYAYDARIEKATQGGSISSNLVKKYQRMLGSALQGAVGPVAAADMMTYFKLQGEIPTREQIIADPLHAPIPSSGAAKCLLITRTLRDMDKEFAEPWMTYLMREEQGEFNKIDQALFGIGTRVKDYPKLRVVASNQKYQEWARVNAHLFEEAK